jgi:hypothetical protein
MTANPSADSQRVRIASYFFLLGVLTAVEFDHDLFFEADKIDDVVSDRRLATKLPTAVLATAQR